MAKDENLTSFGSIYERNENKNFIEVQHNRCYTLEN